MSRFKYPLRIRYKPLSSTKKKKVAEQNEARSIMKMTLIEISIRKCLDCGALFESAGNRRCDTCKERDHV